MMMTNDDASHLDDIAVDRFAAAMKEKPAAGRAKGWGGRDDPSRCPVGRLRAMLADHFRKGDPVDVGSLAMMLWHRGEPAHAPACVWRLADGDSSTWASACGELWSFVDVVPKKTLSAIAIIAAGARWCRMNQFDRGENVLRDDC